MDQRSGQVGALTEEHKRMLAELFRQTPVETREVQSSPEKPIESAPIPDEAIDQNETYRIINKQRGTTQVIIPSLAGMSAAELKKNYFFLEKWPDKNCQEGCEGKGFRGRDPQGRVIPCVCVGKYCYFENDRLVIKG